MQRFFGGLVLMIGILSSVIGAPTDEDLRKVVEQFEKATTNAEQAVRSKLDKAVGNAKDRAAAAKIVYEIDRFKKYREAPGCVKTKEYIHARDAAIATLALRFRPAIQMLRVAKNAGAADELEAEFVELIVGVRGFGPALPDPSKYPLVVIRSKDSGGVLEPVDPRSGSSKVALVGYVRGRPNQVWRMERGETGLAFRCTVGSLYLHVPAGSHTEGERLVLWKPADTLPNEHFCWKADEKLGEVALSSCLNGLFLQAKEITDKGVLKVVLTQEKRTKANSAAQLWTIEEQK